MQKSNIGLVGLAVMGENLARNIERNGFTISVWNRTTSKVDDFIKAHPEATRLKGTHSVQEFIDSLESPRKIILMVKAGDPVDDMIRQIRPYLTRGDILIDGGNSFFQDTRRRHADLARDGILYIGSGVSGGDRKSVV